MKPRSEFSLPFPSRSWESMLRRSCESGIRKLIFDVLQLKQNQVGLLERFICHNGSVSKPISPLLCAGFEYEQNSGPSQERCPNQSWSPYCQWCVVSSDHQKHSSMMALDNQCQHRDHYGYLVKFCHVLSCLYSSSRRPCFGSHTHDDHYRICKWR